MEQYLSKLAKVYRYIQKKTTTDEDLFSNTKAFGKEIYLSRFLK